jgi:hypothetical protein
VLAAPVSAPRLLFILTEYAARIGEPVQPYFADQPRTGPLELQGSSAWSPPSTTPETSSSGRRHLHRPRHHGHPRFVALPDDLLSLDPQEVADRVRQAGIDLAVHLVVARARHDFNTRLASDAATSLRSHGDAIVTAMRSAF